MRILLTFPINLINLEVFFFLSPTSLCTLTSPLHGKLIFSTTQYVFNDCRIDEGTRAIGALWVQHFLVHAKEKLFEGSTPRVNRKGGPLCVLYRPFKNVYSVFMSGGNGYAVVRLVYGPLRFVCRALVCKCNGRLEVRKGRFDTVFVSIYELIVRIQWVLGAIKSILLSLKQIAYLLWL